MTAVFLGNLKLIDDPELIIFDKDGTLIDIHHYWGNIIRIRAKRIVERHFSRNCNKGEIENYLIDAMGIDLNLGGLKPFGPVGVKSRPFVVNVIIQTAKYFGVELTSTEVEDIFFEVDDETLENLSTYLRILPGVKDLLKDARKNKICTALVTNDLTSRAIAAMESLEIDNYFDIILGGEKVTNSKPSSDLAIAVISYFSTNPSKSIVLGDHPVDIKMGQGAGCKINIGVLNGISNEDTFRDVECMLIPDLTHLKIK